MKTTMICAVMFCAALLSAGEPVKFNKNFTMDSQGKLSRWIENKLEVFKPWGAYEIIDDDEGNNALHISATGAEYHILSNDWFKIQEGKTLVIKATVKGSGQFSIGSIVYTDKYKYIYTHYGTRSRAEKAEKVFTFKVAPKGRNGNKVGLGRIFIVGYKGADVTISKLSAEIE